MGPALDPSPLRRAPTIVGAAVLAASLLLLGGCVPSGCPTEVDDLRDPTLRGRIGSRFVAGTAIVQRYVDSPDLDYRGYDVEITSRVAGLAPADQIMFVPAATQMPNIEPGAEVFVVGRRDRSPAGIEPGGCPVLVLVRNHAAPSQESDAP